MTMYEFAKKELELAGYFDKDLNEMIANAVLGLIKVFGGQGHSELSAIFCIQLFSQLAAFKPLTPLTGEDNEWNEVEPGMYQNKRCSTIFKEKGKAYNIYGRVFKEPNGSCYTNFKSRTPVTFPYELKNPEIVDVPAEVCTKDARIEELETALIEERAKTITSKPITKVISEDMKEARLQLQEEDKIGNGR